MDTSQPDARQFPIGRFVRPEQVSPADREAWIQAIEDLPQSLRECTQGLSETQKDTPYRPGGWTMRQVIHHLADSHMNAYVRFRLALTEDQPTVKAYDETRWANLFDAQRAPIELSIDLLAALHARWVLLLRSMTEEEWTRGYLNPQYGTNVTLLHNVLALYAWHSRHHLAHVVLAAEA